LDIVAILKAMAHPARFRILAALCSGEMCVGDLQALLRKRQAYVSQQLARLRGAGLIRCKREDTFCYYSLADPRISVMLHALQAFGGAQSPGGWPGVRFRIKGPVLERNVIPVLYGALQGHPCDIKDLVVFVPTLKASECESGICTVSFVLSRDGSSDEMNMCPNLVRNVLDQVGCKIVAEEVADTDKGKRVA